MAKPLVSASYDKSRFLVMHDPDAHPLESLARGKSREIQCQFIILARKDELTPDFLRNPHVGRPGFLVSMSIHPRTAARPGRHAGLVLTPNCAKVAPHDPNIHSLRQCHAMLWPRTFVRMRFSEEPNDRLHWLRTEGPGTFRLQGNVSGHCRLMGTQSLTCLEYFRTLGPDRFRIFSTGNSKSV